MRPPITSTRPRAPRAQPAARRRRTLRPLAALGRSPVIRRLGAWYERRPLLAGWVSLAVGMEALLLAFTAGAGLAPRELGALAVATLGLAWLCAWVVCLEDSEPEGEADLGNGQSQT